MYLLFFILYRNISSYADIIHKVLIIKIKLKFIFAFYALLLTLLFHVFVYCVKFAVNGFKGITSYFLLGVEGVTAFLPCEKMLPCQKLKKQ